MGFLGVTLITICKMSAVIRRRFASFWLNNTYIVSFTSMVLQLARHPDKTALKASLEKTTMKTSKGGF